MPTKRSKYTTAKICAICRKLIRNERCYVMHTVPYAGSGKQNCFVDS